MTDLAIIKNYQIGSVSLDITEMRYHPEISEIKKQSPKELKNTLIVIIATILELNPKGRTINNPASFNLLSEMIINKFGNLEVQEIEFALKNGIVGAYGTIYNDLSIDTVFGWIGSYIEYDRPKRTEPKQVVTNIEIEEAKAWYRSHYQKTEVVKKSTGEKLKIWIYPDDLIEMYSNRNLDIITQSEFYSKNPDLEKERELLRLKMKKSLTFEECKEFFKLKYVGWDSLFKTVLEQLDREYMQMNDDFKKSISNQMYNLNTLNRYIQTR